MKKIVKRGVIWWLIVCAVAGAILLYIHVLSRFSYWVCIAGILLLALLLCIGYAWLFDSLFNKKGEDEK